MKTDKCKLFLHICCAPCSIEVIESLLTPPTPSQELEKEYEVFGYFYNPNIHPFDEYKKRRDSVVKYLEKLDIKYEIADYDVHEYFDKIGAVQTGKERCTLCYDLRMERTAKRAKELGYDTFTTTLLFNPHKDFEFIAKVGEANAEKYDLHFYFPKLTHDYWKYKDKAKELDMYIQKYCGCVFSTTEK